MTKFLSGREPYFRVGIESTTEDLTSFSVVGNSYFTGIITASGFIGDGSQLTGVVATGQGIIVSSNNVNIGVAGTLNFGQGIDVSPVSTGIVTITTVYSPVAGIASYSNIAGIATYAISSGVATYAPNSGIASYSNVSGLSTYAESAGIATYSNNSGVSTYSVLAGIATYAQVSGISTVSGYSELSGISTNVIGGIASVTRLDVSGITTLGVVTATQILAGIITASNFVGVGSGLTGVIGVSTQWITTSVGLHTLSKVGIGTTRPLYDLHVNGEVVVSGGTSTTQHIKIKGYEQDGGALSFEGSSGQLLSVSNNLTGTIFGINNISGVPIIEANSNGTISLAESGGNVGVGTTLPTSKLYVRGDGFYTGVVTATRFFGDGSQLTGLSAGVSTYASIAGVATYAQFAGIATYAQSAGIATYASIAGVATYAQFAGIATYAPSAGIATIAQGITSTASINTSGIITAYGFVGSASSGYNLTFPGDPNYNNVSLLLHGEGSSGSTSIIDSSPTPKTISRFGNVSISSTQSRFGNGSIYFDGVSGSYMQVSNSGTDFDFPGDFTIEFWFYWANNSGNQMIYDARGSNHFAIGLNEPSAGQIYLFYGFSYLVQAPVSTGSWNHIAISRNSGTIRLFVNGIQQSSLVNNTSFTGSSTNRPIIGRAINNAYELKGYLDEFRVTKGVGRYTSNFVPQIEAFPERLSTFSRSLQLSDLNVTNNYLDGNLGIGTTIPTAKLDVRGNVVVSGIVTASNFVGNLSGTATTSFTSNISGYASTAGIATFSTSSEYASTAGIATFSTSSEYASTAGIATYASSSGYSNTSGLSTYSNSSEYASTAGIATYASSSGYSNTSGIATYASSSGYSNTSGLSTYSNSSGISTYSNSSGISTYSNSSGVSTYSNFSGISTSVIGGIVDVSNLNVSGISTLGVVSVTQLTSTGIVTAFKFVGDGSLLTGVIPSSSSGISISNNDTNVGVALTINFGRYLSVSPASAGIVTVTTPSSIPTGIFKNSSSYIATEGQITFLSDYVVGSIDVFLNGSHLTEDEYIADNGTSIILNEGASEDDLLEIVSSQILFIPFGDYGDISAVTTDSFGIPISSTFDALTDPPATVAINDLGTLS